MSSGFATFVLVLSLASSALAQDWFAAPRFFPDAEQGRIRAVADVDGDGHADLVWVDVRRVQTWFGTGDGEFVNGPVVVPSVDLNLPSPSLDAMEVVPLAGDVDGDGHLDLVLGTNQPVLDAQVVVLLGDGAGNFVESIFDPPAPVVPGEFGELQGIALGDVDGDGVLEIATAVNASGGSRVNWWDWSGLAFAMVSDLVLDPPGRFTALVALDLEPDGDADLVGIAESASFPFTHSVRLMPTVGGAATAGASIPSPHGVRSAAAGDLDGDGDVDVVALGGGNCADLHVLALLNQGGILTPVSSWFTPTAPLGCLWPHPALGDLDGDGDLDVLAAHQTAWSFRNVGNGVFVADGHAHVEPIAAFAGHAAGAADFDHDGHLDLAGPRAIVFGDGGPLAEPPTIDGSPQPPFAAPGLLADHDDDGDLDLFSTTGVPVFTNDATGRFTPTVFYASVPHPYGLPFPNGLLTGPVAVGDFDGDGRRDLILNLWKGFTSVFQDTVLLRDTGTGGFEFAGLGVIQPDSSWPFPLHPDGSPHRAFDVDSDGDLDLVIGGTAYLNDGDGRLQSAGQIFVA